MTGSTPDTDHDRRAIAALIASYGPLLDAGAAEEVAALWAPDGTDDVDGTVHRGREAIAAMVRGAQSTALRSQGARHVLGPHRIQIDGERAVAVGYAIVVLRAEHLITGLTVNEWHLARSGSTWSVTSRTARLIDATPDPEHVARTILQEPASLPDTQGPGTASAT